MTTARSITAAFAPLALAAALACAKEQPATGDTAAPNVSAAAPPAPTAAAVSAAQFGALRWLEGRWRGADTATLVFYEEYQFVDDSTISSRTLTDSTFSRVADSSRIALRGGRLESISGEGKSVYVATQIDSGKVEFTPVRGANNRFVWERVPTGWTARLYPPSGAERLYRMTPIRR